MINLNYHHLYYFYVVAHEGSVISASEKLNIAQPTISAQLKSLEESLGVALFIRSGRGLTLTEVGITALKYADDIFASGKEMMQTIVSHGPGSIIHVRVGVVDVVSKTLVSQALLPVFKKSPEMKVICTDGKQIDLIAKMAKHELDIILSDEPIPRNSRVKAFSHLLGQSSISFLVPEYVETEKLAPFPKCLEMHPILLPSFDTALRRTLEDWFQNQNLEINPIGELEDSVLIKEASCAIGSIFATPSIVANSVCKRYNCKIIGEASDAKYPLYALSLERKVKHPGVALITDRAKGDLFGEVSKL